MIGETDADRVPLFARAAGELLDHGQSAESACVAGNGGVPASAVVGKIIAVGESPAS
jgi:hypothetical protein